MTLSYLEAGLADDYLVKFLSTDFFDMLTIWRITGTLSVGMDHASIPRIGLLYETSVDRTQ